MDCRGSVSGNRNEQREDARVGLTKYSEVLPDASLTPPPNIVVEVLWTCGVPGRVE